MSTIQKLGLTPLKKGKDKALIEFQSVQKLSHINSYSSQDFQGVPINLFRSGDSRYTGTLDAGSVHHINNMVFEITVQNNGGAATTLAALPHWFDRIQFKVQNGSEILYQVYSDELWANHSLISRHERETVLRDANIDSSDNRSGDTYLSAGESRTFYLSLQNKLF